MPVGRPGRPGDFAPPVQHTPDVGGEPGGSAHDRVAACGDEYVGYRKSEGLRSNEVHLTKLILSKRDGTQESETSSQELRPHPGG